MAELPTGTVTLLFTDIEGSTRLLQRAGDSYSELLRAHRVLLRESFTRHSGVVVDTEGDAFFVAFASADDAVAAAAHAQQALAAHDWSDGNEIRVRMGLHTGEPRVIDGAYVGLDVHHAARVMAAGHGGQVLMSGSTRKHVVLERPLLDLGEHRLKDLLQPQHLFQLIVDGLPSEFPALKTLGNRPTNLPVQPNPLIGREDEVAQLMLLVQDPNVRLLTLTGPGGTGKTRLALQAGAELLERFRSGVFFVSLAPVSDPDLVIPTIARTLGLRETAGEQIADTLIAYLREKRMLLIVDNFEHVVDAAVWLARLLPAEEVKLLVTSRVRLRLSAERIYEVPPLALPASARVDLNTLGANESITLFVARAQAVKPEFVLTERNARAVRDICVRLDGLPLALELAAARTSTLTPEALVRRLDERLTLLTGGARDVDDRQRTLRKTIEWSYELLDERERTLFERLSVFVDGCRLEAAEAICGAELGGLQSLIEQSLLRQKSDPDGEPRFWMLETIREYAQERLHATQPAEVAAHAHAEYYLRIAEDAEALSESPGAGAAFLTLQRETENLRAALTWLRDRDNDGMFVRLAAALGHFWAIRTEVREGRKWLEAALASGAEEPRAKQQALRYAFWLAVFGDDFESAESFARERVRQAEATGEDATLAAAVGALARVSQMQGEHERAHELQEQMVEIARRSGNESLTGNALANLGAAALRFGDCESARRAAKEALTIGNRIGESTNVLWMLIPRDVLAETALRLGRLDEAEALYKENLKGMYELDRREDSEVAWGSMRASRGGRLPRRFPARRPIGRSRRNSSRERRRGARSAPTQNE